MDVKTLYKDLKITDKDLLDKDQSLALIYGSAEALNEIKRLNIPKEKVEQYYQKIVEFIVDSQYCKSCKGVSSCKKQNPLLVTKLSYSSGYVDRILSPCKMMLERMKYENIFMYRDFPSSFEDANIRNMDKTTKRGIAYRQVLDFKNNKDMTYKFIYIKGTHNSGKSYFVSAVCNSLANTNFGKIAFISTNFRFKELYDLSFNNKSELDETLLSYCEVPVLVFDDFGSEYKNDFIRDGILLFILNSRKKAGLLTIFTSTFSLNEIANMYNTSKSGYVRSKQLENLLKSECNFIDFGDIPIYQ